MSKRTGLSPSNLWQIDLAGTAAMAGLTVIALASVVYPWLSSRSAFLARQKEFAAISQKAQEAVNDLNALRHELANLRDMAAKNPIHLQAAQSSNQRLADLTQLATQARLDVHETRTGASTIERRFERIPILLAGSGSFPDCATFLSRLRESFPDTGVRSLELSDNPIDAATPTTFKFNLVWHAAPALSSAQE